MVYSHSEQLIFSTSLTMSFKIVQVIRSIRELAHISGIATLSSTMAELHRFPRDQNIYCIFIVPFVNFAVGINFRRPSVRKLSRNRAAVRNLQIPNVACGMFTDFLYNLFSFLSLSLCV